MKKSPQNAILFLLAVLLVHIESSNKYTYSFQYNGTAGAIYNAAYNPVYQLGTLSVNSSITITITTPNNGASLASFQQMINYLSLYNSNGLKYIDYTQSSPVLMSAVDATGANVVLPQATSASSYSFTYTVYFPSSFTGTSASFVLVTGFDAIAALNQLIYYTVEAIAYPSNGPISVATTYTGSTVLKIVDIMRTNTAKIIYVSQPGQIFNFTVYPAAVCTTGSGATCTQNFIFNSYSIATTAQSSTYGFNGNQLTLGSPVTLTSTEKAASATVYTGNEGHYSYNFTTAGYYLLDFVVSYTSYTVARVSFNSDSYACPYPSGYGDFYNVFQGCTQSKSSSGLPCATYDANLAVCTLCVQGYDLINGACFANTTCPARQYFNYGVCLNVSSLCDAFDAFTGACINCSQSSNYNFDNGSCILKTVTCASNQWQANYTCFNVSTSCANFDINTGKCLSCLSELYQLNADGSCTLIIVSCPQRQYAVGLICVTIPSECTNFNKNLSKCLQCISGYYVEGGVCKRVECPDGQVPSSYGIFCINISPLCDAYDSISGGCLSCKLKGYTVKKGKCVQTTNGIAGCSERESLGFGACVGADINCKTFDLITNDCDECQTGFYLDYTGHCTLETQCGAGQWSVNGQCLSYPQNCLKVDKLGLCTQCADESYRLQLGQCVYFKSCQPHQYLNSGSQCVDVSPNCATWNPSSGLCITCNEAGTQPVSGVCCPTGQVYRSGSCVDSLAIQKAYQTASDSSCAVPHPSLQFCLRCNQGYSPDYTVSYGCSPN